MATVFDVASYILFKQGRMTTVKLEKLCYYAQAWSLVWDERPLFDEEFQAWASGPVCPNLYHKHKGMFRIEPKEIVGNPNAIDADGKDTIDAVLDHYAPMSAYDLSELTHHEAPWLEAREKLKEGERCTNVIANSAMAEYYSSFTDGDRDLEE